MRRRHVNKFTVSVYKGLQKNHLAHLRASECINKWLRADVPIGSVLAIFPIITLLG